MCYTLLLSFVYWKLNMKQVTYCDLISITIISGWFLYYILIAVKHMEKHMEYNTYNFKLFESHFSIIAKFCFAWYLNDFLFIFKEILLFLDIFLSKICISLAEHAVQCNISLYFNSQLVELLNDLHGCLLKRFL